MTSSQLIKNYLGSGILTNYYYMYLNQFLLHLFLLINHHRLLLLLLLFLALPHKVQISL